MTIDYARARELMVEQQVRPWGVLDMAVLDVIGRLPREAFVAEQHQALAYADIELPLGHGEKMMKPVVEGRVLQALALDGSGDVLEIGTGSGYQCAVLSRMARFVYSVERYKSLLTEAENRLKILGIDNVFTRHGDGGQGWPEQAPFDRIMVTAASPHEPTELLKQLKPGGVLVAPVGRSSVQMLNRYTGQDDGSFRRESLCEVRFVPLVEGTAKEG